MSEKLILAALVTLSLYLHWGLKLTSNNQNRLLSIIPSTETVELLASKFSTVD